MLFLLMLPGYLLVNLYISFRLLHWFRSLWKKLEGRIFSVTVTVLYFALALSPVLAFVLPRSGFSIAVRRLSTYWMGILLYFLSMLLIADLLRLAVRRTRLKDTGLFSRLGTVSVGGAVFVCAGLLCLYGAIHARQIKTTEYELTVNKQVSGMEELNAVLIADTHMGYAIGRDHIAQMVEKINACHPDIVIFAGDIFDNSTEGLDYPDELAELFRSIDSKYGVEKSESKSALSISTLHHVCGDGAYFQFLKENMKEEFRYDYLEASPDEVLGNLSSGRSELGILFCTLSSRNMFFQEIEHKGLIFHHLAYTNAYVYVSSTHPYAKKESVFFSDMASFPFVSYDYQNPNAERYTSAFMQNKQFHKVLHVSDRATAYSLLRTVDAFSIGSGYISADEKYGDIISIPISDCDKIEVGWLSRSNHILSEQAASFIAILERMISVNTEEGEGFQRTDSV